ncbi:hypothetical protein KUCAC02_017789, partial [Chaenocephalus aceratus]
SAAGISICRQRALPGGPGSVTLSPCAEVRSGGLYRPDQDSCINLEVSSRSEKRGLMGEN